MHAMFRGYLYCIHTQMKSHTTKSSFFLSVSSAELKHGPARILIL